MNQEKDEYIYGRNAVLEAIAGGREIEKIFLGFGVQGNAIKKIYASAGRKKIPVTSYDKNKFAQLEKKACPKGANSQGVIAMAALVEAVPLHEMLQLALANHKYPIVIAADGINDPHNLGAIARAAECSGASGLIIPERNSAPLGGAAMKSSAGALEHLPVTKVGSMIETIDKCREFDFWVAGTDMEAVNNYYDDIYSRPLLLIIGSEGKGISPAVRKHCDTMIKIPLHGRIESLNASVSAGIILFERLRQLRDKSKS